MKKQIIYGILAVAGLCLTWYHNIQFMQTHGASDIGAFIKACTVNHAATSISWDVTISAIAFLTWAFIETKRLQMKHWWAYLVLTFGVAMAFGFPLFLLMRERRLTQLKAAAGT